MTNKRLFVVVLFMVVLVLALASVLSASASQYVSATKSKTHYFTSPSCSGAIAGQGVRAKAAQVPCGTQVGWAKLSVKYTWWTSEGKYKCDYATSAKGQSWGYTVQVVGVGCSPTSYSTTPGYAWLNYKVYNPGGGLYAQGAIQCTPRANNVGSIPCY